MTLRIHWAELPWNILLENLWKRKELHISLGIVNCPRNFLESGFGVGCIVSMKNLTSFWYFCIPLMPNNTNWWDMRTVGGFNYCHLCMDELLCLMELSCSWFAWLWFTVSVFLWRGRGPLKHTCDVINAAKMISESGSRMDVLARLIADQVSHQSCRDLPLLSHSHTALALPALLHPCLWHSEHFWATGYTGPVWTSRGFSSLYQCSVDVQPEMNVYIHHTRLGAHTSARAFGQCVFVCICELLKLWVQDFTHTVHTNMYIYTVMAALYVQ